MYHHISVILPCRNEGVSMRKLLPRLRQVLPEAEILVVDDASSEDIATICTLHGAVYLRHP